MPAARAGEDQPERVDPGLLLGAGLLGPGGEPVRQRVPVRGADGVDGAAVLAALGCLDVQLPGDLDELAVHGDDPGRCGDLAGGQGEQLALPQPGVGRDIGHQLIQLTPPPGGQGLAEPGDVSGGRDLGRVDPQRRFPGRAGLRLGHGPGGLPVHLPQPRGWPGTRP